MAKDDEGLKYLINSGKVGDVSSTTADVGYKKYLGDKSSISGKLSGHSTKGKGWKDKSIDRKEIGGEYVGDNLDVNANVGFDKEGFSDARVSGNYKANKNLDLNADVGIDKEGVSGAGLGANYKASKNLDLNANARYNKYGDTSINVGGEYKFKKGGKVTASTRADGIAQRGKTRGHIK